MIVFKIGDAILLANTVELAQSLIKTSLDASLAAGVSELPFGEPSPEELHIVQAVLEQRGVPK